MSDDLSREKSVQWLIPFAQSLAWVREHSVNCECQSMTTTSFRDCVVVGYTSGCNGYVGRVLYLWTDTEPEGIGDASETSVCPRSIVPDRPARHPSCNPEQRPLSKSVVSQAISIHDAFKAYWSAKAVVDSIGGETPKPNNLNEYDLTLRLERSIRWLCPEYRNATWLAETLVGRPFAGQTIDEAYLPGRHVVAYGVGDSERVRVWTVPVDADPFEMPAPTQLGWLIVSPNIHAGQRSKPATKPWFSLSSSSLRERLQRRRQLVADCHSIAKTSPGLLASVKQRLT